MWKRAARSTSAQNKPLSATNDSKHLIHVLKTSDRKLGKFKAIIVVQHLKTTHLSITEKPVKKFFLQFCYMLLFYACYLSDFWWIKMYIWCTAERRGRALHGRTRQRCRQGTGRHFITRRCRHRRQTTFPCSLARSFRFRLVERRQRRRRHLVTWRRSRSSAFTSQTVTWSAVSVSGLPAGSRCRRRCLEVSTAVSVPVAHCGRNRKRFDDDVTYRSSAVSVLPALVSGFADALATGSCDPFRIW